MNTDDSSLPLVSCIMPTANRRSFVPKAIRYFLRQEYNNKELVILDDGADCVADLIPDDPRIRYSHTTQRRSIGAKRNACIESAHGDLILHWDDDDWMAPYRIRYQVEVLLKEEADMCGLRQMLFHDQTSGTNWLYDFEQGQPAWLAGTPLTFNWLAGGSFLYKRDAWRRGPFLDMDVGEDTKFLWNRPDVRTLALPNFLFYVAIVHGENTSRKIFGGPNWQPWQGDLRLVMGSDLDEYETRALSDNSVDAEQHLVLRTGFVDPNSLRLNLGCGDALLQGFVNVDLAPGQGNEQVDLRQVWPWSDGSVSLVRARQIIQFLPDKVFTMNEMWRVLACNGVAEIVVPTTDGTGAFQDPMHVSFWNRRSFHYYEADSPYRERNATQYGIVAKFRTLESRIEQTVDGPMLYI